MLSICVAMAEKNVIGGDNKLLWHISDDLKRFKELTLNKTIIMGRKTFESLPGILPGRHHVVLTRDENYTIDSPNVTIVHDLNDILTKYENSVEEAFIIGGGELYNLTLPHCNKLFLTKIKSKFAGDTFFPEINYNNWKITYTSGEKTNAKDGLAYEFINLEIK